MDTFDTVIKLVMPDMYFASTDNRHGYYSIPIAEEDRKSLDFHIRINFTCPGLFSMEFLVQQRNSRN